MVRSSLLWIFGATCLATSESCRLISRLRLSSGLSSKSVAKRRLESLPKRKAEFIEPMECALVPTLPEGSDWTYEVKLDGYRAIGVKTSRDTILYSRNSKNFN